MRFLEVFCKTVSTENFSYYPCLFLDAREPLIESPVFDGETPMVDAHQVQDRSIEIPHVNRILDNVVAELIGLSVGHAPFDPTSSKPHGVAFGMVVASVVVPFENALTVDGTAELTSPDYQGIV